MDMNCKILRKNSYIYAITVFMSVLIVFQPLIMPVQALEDTSVSIDPSTQTVSPGGSFTVDVFCVPGQPIKSFEFMITFNPSLVRVNSVSEGDIFDGYPTFFNNGSIDNIGGTIENIYGLILGSGIVSSSGTFVTVSFTAKSTSGTSTITLSNVGVTNNSGYVPIVVSGGSVQIIASNQPPVFSAVSPTNSTINIPITRTSLSVTIRDPDGDHFSFTIQTHPNIGSVSVQNAANGTKSCMISGLSYGTVYRWYINATDGTHWTRRWYIFTTASAPVNNPPSFSSINPSNGSTNIPISTSSISLIIRDPEGKPFNYTIQTHPNVGSVSVHAAQNGTKQCLISGLTYSTTYRWYVNATDGVNWIKKWYIFTSESENTGGNPPGGGGSDDTSPSENETPSVPEQNNPPNPPTQPIGPTLIQRDVTYTYSSSAFDSDGDKIRLRFYWGDGTSSEWTPLTPSNVTVTLFHEWNNISSYSVSGIAQDENGSNSSWSIPLTVTVSEASSEEEPPNFDITTPLNTSVNQTVQFNVSGTFTLNNETNSYFWDFGDGTTATGKTPVHIFKNPGIYTVTLTVTDSSSKIYKKSVILTVATSAQDMAQEKQDFLFPYVSISLIGFVIVILFILIKFFRKRTKTYSSIKSIDHRQTLIHQPAKKIVETTSHEESKPIVKNIHLERKKAMSPSPTDSCKENIEKEVDDILISKMHEEIDKM